MNKGVKTIASKSNYLTPLRYQSGRIVEYDIRSANISILRTYNAIDENYYNYLKNLPKSDREIEIGLLIQRDKNIYNIISKGIEEHRLMFLEANNIKSEQIIRIANDAIYINTPFDLDNRFFGDYVEFRQKSISSSILVLSNSIIIFSKYLPNGMIDIDIKGINKNIVYHQDYICSVLGTAIYMLDNCDIYDTMNYINEFIEKYLKLELSIEYYREFNSQSLYRIKGSEMGISYMSESDINLVDITYNYTLLRELWSIIFERINIGR